MAPTGALVKLVRPGTPAEAAKLLAGDVILIINDKPVTHARNLSGMVRETYDRVMDGMGVLQNALMGGKESGAVTLTYEEEVTYTSASMEISVLA
jgi:S1-C subfamily serine protease